MGSEFVNEPPMRAARHRNDCMYAAQRGCRVHTVPNNAKTDCKFAAYWLSRVHTVGFHGWMCGRRWSHPLSALRGVLLSGCGKASAFHGVPQSKKPEYERCNISAYTRVFPRSGTPWKADAFPQTPECTSFKRVSRFAVRAARHGRRLCCAGDGLLTGPCGGESGGVPVGPADRR